MDPADELGLEDRIIGLSWWSSIAVRGAWDSKVRTDLMEGQSAYEITW